MPATKEQPNLRLLTHFPDLAPDGVAAPGAVVPAHAVSDPDRIVELGAAVWTGDPVTVSVAPPAGAKAVVMSPAHLATADELAAIRKQAEAVAEAKLKVEDDNAELKEALAKANADVAAGEAATKELAELKAAVAAAKSLNDAKAAAK